MKDESGISAPLFRFERGSPEPFYKQIYEGYRAAILTGRLRPGQRLPSTRMLASELSISRLPVVNAFEQLLHEGYIEGKVGAGTYVKESIPDELSEPLVPVRIISEQNLQRDSGTQPADEPIGPFRVSLPGLDHFPNKIWARLVTRHAKNFGIKEMAYGNPAGHWPLREAIARYLRTARAVHCNPSQVLIVSGSQLALQICAMSLLKQGEAVCVEEPGYSGARDALKMSGAKLVPISVDEEGLDVHAFASLGKRVRAAYVTPSHQYPLGVSMSASRRLELLDWAHRNKSWILEDDYDSEYRYSSRPLGSLQGMDSSSRVIYIGTFSKVLFPSVRVGYIVAPPELVLAFTRLRESFDIFSPTLFQMVLTDFLQEGHFARHLRRMRNIYLNRRNALVESIKLYCGKLLQPHNIEAGLHLTAFLPKDIDDVEVVRRAALRGISANPLSVCYAGKTARSGLILGFGGATEPAIRRATKTLSELIHAMR